MLRKMGKFLASSSMPPAQHINIDTKSHAKITKPHLEKASETSIAIFD